MYNSIVMLSSGLSSAERTSTAGIVTLQGMLTIFAVLAILWGATELMHTVLHRDRSKPKKEDAAPAPNKASVTSTPNAEDAAVAAAIAATLAAYEDSGATVAAITAAITAARADEGNTGAFRVVSFKRAQTANRRKSF